MRNEVFSNKIIESEEGDITYLQAGDGPCIIFLHGYMETKEVWIDFASRFVERYRVIIIDLPGHGESSLKSSINSMENMALVIYQIIIHNNIKKAIFIGHSMGGFVLLAFLEKYPSLVKAIVMLNSITMNDNEKKLEERKKEIYLLNKGKKDLLINYAIPNSYFPPNRDYFSNQISNSIARARQISKENIIAHIKGIMSRPDRTDILISSKVPYIILHGNNDSLFDSMVIINEKLIHKSNFRKIENCSHMSFIEQADDVFDVVIDFMLRIDV